MKRVTTAVLGGMIIALAILLHISWAILVCVAFMIVAKEVGQILGKIGFRVSVLAMVLVVPGFVIPPVYFSSTASLEIGVAAALVIFIVATSGYGWHRAPAILVGLIVATIYPSILASFLVEMRLISITYLVFVLLIVFAGDIAALYVGGYLTEIGRAHKIPERLGRITSPNKTYEGFIAGFLAGGIVIPLIFSKFGAFPIGRALSVGVACSVAAMAGDLFESFLKRRAGVKDSGTILPGHGGMLDRFDALLFAAFVGALMVG